MLKRSREERALSSVAAEARRAPEPDVDWAGAEGRLLARVRRDQAASGNRRRRIVTSWSAPALALVFAALVLFVARRHEPAPSAPLAEAPSSIDGDEVPRERLLIAEREPLTTTHGARAAWTLSPGGRARVVEHGDVIRVRLLEGALHARVTPSPLAERFVVEAGTTRVAVHGTVFRVSMEQQGTLVQVEEGTVAVDSNGDPRVFLRAPADARFAAAGRVPERVAVQRRTAPSRAPKAASSTTEPPASTTEPPLAQSEPVAESLAAEPTSSGEPVVAPELTIGEVEAGVAVLVAAANHCFERHTAASGNLRVTARTEVTLSVVADGTVKSVAFSPPLAPAVQACSEREGKALTFPASQNGATVRRLLELGAGPSRAAE